MKLIIRAPAPRRALVNATRLAVALCAIPLAAPSMSAQAATPGGGLAPGVHEVSINGALLWYRVAGDSASKLPPVVFLHGGPGYNSYSFSVLEGPRLEPHLRIVYFDQRGSGRSERPASHDYALSTLVDDVEGLRRALGVRRINLVGHSFGSILALEYAARYPERVSHLILVSAPSDLPASCAVRKARLLELYPALRSRADSVLNQGKGACEVEFALLRGEQHSRFSAAIMFPDTMLRRQQDSIDTASGLKNTGEVGSALMRNGLLSYRFSATERLTMPVLVIAGGVDASVGVEPQRKLAQSIRGARFVTYPRAGHFVYLDEPVRFAHDVIAFVSNK